MKLNKLEKQILLRAIELIDNKTVICSCDAITDACFDMMRGPKIIFEDISSMSSNLKLEYNKFYHDQVLFSWPGLSVMRKHPKQRVLLLSLFLTANS